MEWRRYKQTYNNKHRKPETIFKPSHWHLTMLLFWMRTAKLRDFFFKYQLFLLFFRCLLCIFILTILSSSFRFRHFYVLFRNKIHKISENWIDYLCALLIRWHLCSHNECFVLFRVKDFGIFLGSFGSSNPKVAFSWKTIILHNFLLSQKISHRKYAFCDGITR